MKSEQVAILWVGNVEHEKGEAVGGSCLPPNCLTEIINLLIVVLILFTVLSIFLLSK